MQCTLLKKNKTPLKGFLLVCIKCVIFAPGIGYNYNGVTQIFFSFYKLDLPQNKCQVLKIIIPNFLTNKYIKYK